MADWTDARDPARATAATKAGWAAARAEQEILEAVAKAMTAYLRLVTDAVLGPGYRPPPYLTAAATTEPPPDLDAWPPPEVWVALFDKHVTPLINKVFGEAFAAQARGTVLSDHVPRLSYLANVHDRLSTNLWPAGVFEEARYELLEGLANGESVDQLRDRVGSVTHIDAYSRAVRADINHHKAIRDDPNATPEDRQAARVALRELYPALDDADTMWHYQARRVARTETMGAVNGGSWAGAVARGEATGEQMYKQWLATDDHRTRDSHVAADGQIQPINAPFDVGGAPLQHPGEAGGPAHEVINCRCTSLFLSADEAAAAGHPVTPPPGGLASPSATSGGAP